MNDFLTASACYGRRPRSLSSVKIVSRPNLVARLMDERQVARFLIAPFGYGKTCVASEYAQLVFGFSNVNWIDADSPCFKRDLDKGSLAEDLLERHPGAQLVVFDDVPRMGSYRAEEFSRCLDVLLAHGCEVLVLTTPSCDSFSRLQPDRICLVSEDFLLPFDLLPENDVVDSSVGNSDAYSGKNRIPLFAWGQESNLDEVFAKGQAKELLPHEVVASFFISFVLGEPNEAAFAHLMLTEDMDSLFTVISRYPHFGYSPLDLSAEAISLSVESLVKAYRGHMNSIVEACCSDDLGDFVLELAALLVDMGEEERACDLVRLLSPVNARRTWIQSHGPMLLNALKPLPLCKLINSAPQKSDIPGAHGLLLLAKSLLLLGNASEAVVCASRLLRRHNVSPTDRAEAASFILLHGSAEQREAAKAFLSEKALISNAFHGVQLVLATDQSRALEEWTRWRDQDACSDELARAAACMLSVCPEQMIPYLTGYLSAVDLSSKPSLLEYEVVKACRLYEERSEEKVAVSPDLLLRYFGVQSSLALQAKEYEDYRSKRKVNRITVAPTTPADPDGAPLAQEAPKPSEVPCLEIRVFGGLEVSMGGALLSNQLFRRKKVRTLLAILVLHAGEEISREKLVRSMWPENDLDSGCRNFYSVWSFLKRSLSTANGICPYLFHVRGGYKIEARYLKSDYGRVNELCEMFVYDGVDAGEWQSALRELMELCRGEIMPGEAGNRIIYVAQEKHRAQLVEALYTGACRLLEEGHPFVALKFAQEAFNQNKAREDIYYVLMSSQLACGQREAALNTFYLDKRFLADTLGIDPSARMIRLYRSIIEQEEDF